MLGAEVKKHNANVIAITASVQVKDYTVYQTFMNICALKNEFFMNFL